GRSELLPATRTKLDAIANGLRGKRNLRFSIAGHADTQRLSATARKRYVDNQGLSEARAFEVAQYLRGQLGLRAEAFTIRGAGDREPVAENTTPEGMAKNRRVELQIWYERENAVSTAPTAPIDRDACASTTSAGATSATTSAA